MKAVIILSGGVDSTTLLYKLVRENYEVYALSFNYGQRHNKELEMAKKTCEKLGVNHKIVDISSIKELLKGNALTDNIEVPEGHYNKKNMKITVVPNRNMIFLSLAIAYAINIGVEKVYYAPHSGDHAIYPDCRPEFIETMKKVAKLCDWKKIEIETPFINIDKGDIVMLGKELGVDYSLTWSCYKGGEKPCGKCGTCIERKEAFEKAGIKDPLEYE